jgi:hypothetical protein
MATLVWFPGRTEQGHYLNPEFIENVTPSIADEDSKTLIVTVTSTQGEPYYIVPLPMPEVIRILSRAGVQICGKE